MPYYAHSPKGVPSDGGGIHIGFKLRLDGAVARMVAGVILCPVEGDVN